MRVTKCKKKKALKHNYVQLGGVSSMSLPSLPDMSCHFSLRPWHTKQGNSCMMDNVCGGAIAVKMASDLLAKNTSVRYIKQTN